MNGIIRVLWVVGLVAPLMCVAVSAETREERKLRIERKYLFEQQEVVQLNLELPDDPDEDPFGRDPDFKAGSDESLASGTGMVRRPSVAPVRRATSFAETEEEYGLFGETSDGDVTAADLRRQKLDDNWQRLMDAQRTRNTERSSSPGYSGSIYGSNDSLGYGSSPYSSGASSGSASSSGYSSFSQPQPAAPSALGPGSSMNSLTSPMRTTESSLGATRTTTPGFSSSSSSATTPSAVSPVRSTTPRTTTTPSSTPSTRSGFRGTDGGSLLDLDNDF
ncbi:MAG: hypothetical protein JXR23_02360 [Pontiellaceae bacterium]|nr:hypothetical protein [Pontiellaceae bacterium]